MFTTPMISSLFANRHTVYALENPGVWGWPQGEMSHHDSENGYRKFTIFTILHLPAIKTVTNPFDMPLLCERGCI